MTDQDKERIEITHLLDELCEDEGNQVTLGCSNPDFNGLPNEKIVVLAEFTQWQEREFTGNALLDCLRRAVEAKGR
jgi:hypothetical protein